MYDCSRGSSRSRARPGVVAAVAASLCVSFHFLSVWLSFDISGFSGRLFVSVAVVVAEVVQEEVAEVVADVVDYGTFCTLSVLSNITRHTNLLDSQSEHSKLQTNEKCW